jgi:hypothetical protein
MLEQTARDALRENQETGIRRIIRTFDPDIPGYVFWLVMLGLISFQVRPTRQIAPTDDGLSGE